jgi:serine/threonine protein phosphatase 1
MKKTFVIGDIHGGLKALEQVLQRANITVDDSLIFLGDYVDGWSQSAQTIDFLIQLSNQQHCVFIKGNHDAWCEAWLKTGHADSTWLFHGGQATVDCYAGLNEEEKLTHLHFFEQTKMFHVDEQNRLFIHAGFTSMHGPEKEFHSSNYTWDRTLWEMAITMDKRVQKDSLLYPKRLKLFHEIYIGHTPTLYYDVEIPMQGVNVWNVDTGAAFTGALTIMDIDTKQFWQSDKVTELYPTETGRNKAT